MKGSQGKSREYWLGIASPGVVLGVVIGALACGGCGGKVSDYSATQVTTRGGSTVQTNKIFVSGQKKMRIEMPHPSGRGNMVNIMRQDKGVIWMVFPEQRMYTEMNINQSELASMTKEITTDQIIEELGSETVAGYSCRKVKTRSKITVLGRTIESTSTAWISSRITIPLRTEHENGMRTELKDIATGGQPADLFEIPEGFTKTESMFPGMFDRGRDGRGSESLSDKLKKLKKRR